MSRESLKDSIQSNMLNNLLPIITNQKLSNLKMSDIAIYLGVSRATLYKYFPSKTHILKSYTSGLSEYIEELSIGDITKTEEIIDVYPKVIIKEISLKLLFPDIFIMQVEKNYSDIYLEITNDLEKHSSNLKNYYKRGMQLGVFNENNIDILILQEELIPKLWDKKFLGNTQLTIESALTSYININILQLVKQEFIGSINMEELNKSISYMSEKITRIT